MNAWIVRAGRGGIHAAEWLEGGYVAIYWNLDGADVSALDKEGIKRLYKRLNPDASPQTVASNAGMVYRFAHDIAEGCTVVMYDPSTRLYHIGEVSGGCEFLAGTEDDEVNGSYRRRVRWHEVAPRDSLSASAKHSLGSISTLFAVSEDAMRELKAASSGVVPVVDDDESPLEAREATADDGIERIKDKVLKLDWDDMELLAAGVLRSMGYKTSMTRKGSDGGRDIIASPDGLGLESPRIVIEVKHRKGAMGAPALRSFIGGLRSTDSGLYIYLPAVSLKRLCTRPIAR